MLCGCTFIQHDYERDYRQVAAYLESYEIDTSAKDEPYVTTPKTIYKRDLVDYVYNNQSSLSQSFQTAESMYKYAIEMLVNTEIVINEVDALIDAGIVDWGVAERNTVKQRIYESVDSTLVSLQNQILESADKPQIGTSGDSDVSTDTTYPVKPDPEYDFPDDDPDEHEPEPWTPSLSKYPGVTTTDPDRRSLENAAMRDFVTLIRNRVKDDFRVTDEDKKLFAEDDKKIDEIIDTKGIGYVYEIIGDTHYMYYLTGKNYERAQKIASLQEYLTESASIGDDEVVRSYNDTLTSQRSEYTADPSAYDTAITGDTTVLYHPNTNYFFVKHILLPFSDEQTAELTAFKARLNVTKTEIEEFRARLADAIVCYPHVAGEDDKSRPMTVKQVFDVVKKEMTPLQYRADLADVKFDDLIYDYGTDPGSFGNNKGYAVKYKLAEGENETYMQEFADAARYMRDNLEVGQVYGEPVITDYGVHIMYFASTTSVGEVGLYDYTTPGRVETYFDVLKAPLVSARENAAYTDWENEKLSYNYKQHATLYEDRYKNLWNA